MRYHKLKANDEPDVYTTDSPKVTETGILTLANPLSRQHLAKGSVLSNPVTVQSYMQALLQDYEQQVVVVVLLDSRLRSIGVLEMFQGTLDTTTVYPGEVVKLALEHNAAALIMAHNHPSGDPTPSASEIHLSKNLKQALALVNIRVLDHIVVGAQRCISLVQKGLI